jgi:tetratricopeptide (TPR) repeat protein
METSNSIDEQLRQACLKREVGDYDGALAELDGTSAKGERELVLLAVRAEKAFHKQDQQELRQIVDELDLKCKEIKAKAPIPTMLVFRAMCELGRARCSSSDFEIAGQIFRTALGLAQDEYGKTGIEMIYPAICLAMYHETQKNYVLSVALARDAVSLIRRRQSLVSDSSILLAGLLTMARSAYMDKRYALCLKCADEALELAQREKLSSISERLIDCSLMRMMALYYLDRHQEAKDSGEVLIESMEDKYGRYSPKLLEPLCQLASVYERLGARDRASKCLDQALVIVSEVVQEKPFGDVAQPDDMKPESMPMKEYQMLNRLSETLVLQGKFVDALKLYPSSVRARYTVYVAQSNTLVDALTRHLNNLDEDIQRSKAEKAARAEHK